MDLDETLESSEFVNNMASASLKRSLQRTFSFPSLSINDKAPCESLPPSPLKQVYGLCPITSLRTLDDLDSKTLYVTLSALLEQHQEDDAIHLVLI